MPQKGYLGDNCPVSHRLDVPIGPFHVYQGFGASG
jgi:hypothetical protein